MRTFKLTLCYDGTRYNGWQKQGNTDNTIQEKLETLLSRLFSQPIEVAGSGRTDAGVHAEKQVCSFRADTTLTCEELLSQIRKYLPEDIGAVSLEDAPDRFHARLNAVEKTYTYSVWNSEAPNVFRRRYCFEFTQTLDLDAMRKAAALLLGEHDFTSFCSQKRMKKSAVRELRKIEIQEQNGLVTLRFTGNGFLYNMVRILTGTLLEVGSGKRSPEEMPFVLAAKDRSAAGFTAPACGLCLSEVQYKEPPVKYTENITGNTSFPVH